MKALKALAGLVSVGFDWFAPVPKPRDVDRVRVVVGNRRPVAVDVAGSSSFWDGEQPLADGPRIRVVDGRGLGPDERDAEWIDNGGDRWRWNTDSELWEYNHPDNGDDAWYYALDINGYLSDQYAPFAEIIVVPDDPGEFTFTPDEPPFTNDEIRTIRTIIDWGRAIDDVVGDYNAAIAGTFNGPVEASSAGSSATARAAGAAAEERPALSVVTDPKPEQPSAGHLKNLLRAAAVQIDAYSTHIACPAATYSQALARQLREASNRLETQQ